MTTWHVCEDLRKKTNFYGWEGTAQKGYHLNWGQKNQYFFKFYSNGSSEIKTILLEIRGELPRI